MSNATCKRARKSRLQPYAWLGAGAVTLSLGAAMVGGTAIAFADTGTDSASASDSSATDTSSPKSSAGKNSATRSSRRSAPDASAVTRQARGRAAVAPPAALTNVPKPAAAVSPRLSRGSKPSAAAASKSTASNSTAASQASPAAVANPAADPSYNMTSYLPATPIVPGAHVTLALEQIAAAKTDLNQETFGSGKVVAGVAAIGPQLFLSGSAFALEAWQTQMPKAQQRLADAQGIPVMHQIAQLNLQITMALPTLAQVGLSGAALLMPLVNLLGASTATTESLVSSARSNGKVYVSVPVTMKANTEPVVYISVNGGKKVPVLVDTGSSGLVLTRDAVGAGDLGPATGTGTSGYSGGLTYDYTTYDTVVDFGGGAVTEPTSVNVVDAADAQAFTDYLAPAGVVGVLGVGANTAGPGEYPDDLVAW